MTFTAVAGVDQIHSYGGTGDNLINLNFDNINKFSHGHHTRGDPDGNGIKGHDTFNFTNIDEVLNGAVIVGRIEDFDASRDTLMIEGIPIDFSNLPNNVRIVEFNGNHRDPYADPQKWILIETPSGGHIFYALHGARVDIDGLGASNGGAQEGHFIQENEVPDFSQLNDAILTPSVNVVPKDYHPDPGGLVINDDDNAEIIIADNPNTEKVETSTFDVSRKIFGSRYGDVIAAGLNNDLVEAQDGDDTVWGGDGHDLLFGQGGNDTLFGGFGDDVLVAGSGDQSQGAQNLYGEIGSDSYHIGKNSGLVLITAEAEQFNFEDFDQVVFDDLNMNEIAVSYGTDIAIQNTMIENALVLSWETGQVIIANSGDNIEAFVFQNGDTATHIDTTNGQWVLIEDVAMDADILGDGLNNVITSYSGNDYLVGGAGNDVIVDSSGDDFIEGGQGNDICIALSGNNEFLEFDSGSNSYIRSINDFFAGGFGDDLLSGGDGNDILIGDFGTAFYFGEDILIGGTGDDVMQGGGGADVFVFHDLHGNDTIGIVEMSAVDSVNGTIDDVMEHVTQPDFQIGVDLIDLQALNFVNDIGDLDIYSMSGHAVVETSPGQTIILVGVIAAELSADDFLF